MTETDDTANQAMEENEETVKEVEENPTPSEAIEDSPVEESSALADSNEIIEETPREEDEDEKENDSQDRFPTTLPLSRVKKIMKLDPDTRLVPMETVKLMTLATERFIGLLAKAAYTQAVMDKRKTVQMKDIDRVIASNYSFEFLEGTLDGWPETSKASKVATETIPEGDDDVVEVVNDEVEASTEDASEELPETVPPTSFEAPLPPLELTDSYA